MLSLAFFPWARSTFSPWNLAFLRTISSVAGTLSRRETCVSSIYQARMEGTSCNWVASGLMRKPSKKPHLRLSAVLALSVTLSPRHTLLRDNLRSFLSSRRTRQYGKVRFCLSETVVSTVDRFHFSSRLQSMTVYLTWLYSSGLDF